MCACVFVFPIQVPRSIPSAHVLVSKYYSPLKELELLGKITDC